MIPYPDFEEAEARLRCCLTCYSRPDSILWFFTEDAVAFLGHAFYQWPLESSQARARVRYERLRATGSYVRLGYYCTVGGRSACYLSTANHSNAPEDRGLEISLQSHPDVGHRVPHVLWPLVAGVLRRLGPGAGISLSWCAPAQRQESVTGAARSAA